MFCEKCGKELPDGSSYCDGCGAMIGEETSEKAARSVGAAENPVPVPKKKNLSWIAVSVAGVLLIVLTVFLSGVLSDMGLGSLFGGAQKQQGAYATPVETADSEASEDDPYAEYLQKYADFVLPESDERYLSYRDVKGLSWEEAELAVMELQARHGRQFTQQAQAYFNARDWYTPGSGHYEPNAYESANELLLRVHQRKLDGTLYQQENSYLSQFPESRDYAVAGSDSRYMTAEDLKPLNAQQLILARNEIYARKGCVFQTEDLQEYFYTKEWYEPSIPVGEFRSDELNPYEKNNIKFVGIYEKRLEGVYFSADNPYIGVYEKYGDWGDVLPDSSDRELTASDLLGLTVEELVIARNEIYARNGYTFSSENLLEYFLQTDWYFPDTACGDTDALSFTKLEKANISLLKERETFLEKNIGAGDVTQQSKYVYVTSGSCYHIPVVERSGVNAKSINSQMYERYSKLLQEKVFSLYAEERLLTGLTYVVGQKGDVVTVLVRQIDGTDCDSYDVFYFSASTGKTLSAEDVFSAYGMSNEQGYGMIRKAMEAYWQRQEANGGSQDAYFQFQKNQTLSDSNVRGAKPWIDENGALQFCGEIYALAGADSYWHCFDEAGYMISVSCQEH